jgi:hypothetical protein
LTIGHPKTVSPMEYHNCVFVLVFLPSLCVEAPTTLCGQAGTHPYTQRKQRRQGMRDSQGRDTGGAWHRPRAVGEVRQAAVPGLGGGSAGGATRGAVGGFVSSCRGLQTFGERRACSICGWRPRAIPKWVFCLNHRLETVFNILHPILGLGHQIGQIA